MEIKEEISEIAYLAFKWEFYLSPKKREEEEMKSSSDQWLCLLTYFRL